MNFVVGTSYNPLIIKYNMGIITLVVDSVYETTIFYVLIPSKW